MIGRPSSNSRPPAPFSALNSTPAKIASQIGGSDILFSRELLKIGKRKYGASPIGNFYVLLFLCPKLVDQF
jgi:hypothetical protein